MVASIGEAIVTAPSNAAVANIAMKVLALHTELSVSNVVIFGENCHESVQFLSPTHRSRQFITFREKYWKKRREKSPEQLLTDFTDWLGLDRATVLRGKLLSSEVEKKLLNGKCLVYLANLNAPVLGSASWSFCGYPLCDRICFLASISTG